MRWLPALIALLFALPSWGMNFVVVIMDDAGANIVSAYDSVYPTVANMPPTTNLDALAAVGIRFDNASGEPNCSPMRVALLTGRHPYRTGVGAALSDSVVGGNGAWGLDVDEQTIAKVLQANGYRTSITGKYHMCGANQDGCSTGNGAHAVQLGFEDVEIQAGSVEGAEGGYYNTSWCDNGTCTLSADYSMTKIVNEGIAEIDAGELDEPFFAWVAPVNIHGAIATPDHCPPDALTPTYDAVCTPIGTETSVQAVSYASMEAMDTELQRLFDAIDPAKETCLIVVGDNGLTNLITDLTQYVSGHNKNTTFQQGVRVPLIIAGDCVEASEVGTVATQAVQVTDLAATILDLAGLSAGVGDGTYEITDGIPITTYLAASDAPSIRTTTFSEFFAPTGLPYATGSTTTLVRRAQHSHYSMVKLTNGTETFYENTFTTDITEQTALNPASLTAAQQAAYDLVNEVIDRPDHISAPTRTRRISVDVP